jgi:hypothetical protein
VWRRRWAKPRGWHGRANRLWRVAPSADALVESWTAREIPTDTLHFQNAGSGAALANVHSNGTTKAFLWVGANGRYEAVLNGVTVLSGENRSRYRTGQFQQAVELRSGNNQLLIRVTAAEEGPKLSALLVGARNDGDTCEGVRWLA